MERSYTQTTPYKIKAPDGTTLEGKWFRSKERFQQDLKAGEVRFLKKNDDNWSVQFKQRMAEGRKVRSLMNENEYKSSQDNLEAIGLESVFSFPKPVHLLKVLTQAATTKDSNDIVLDFFAGSGTTAQAVLELNREDGGNRQFICVQLPEPTGGAEYSTIADISRERIRRVTAKMQAAQNGTLDVSTRETPEDLGFKAFKLSSSNFRQWQDLPPETDAEEYARQMELFNDPLLENWTPHDVLYEVALKEGYSLTSRIEAVAPDEDGEIWRVTDDDKKQHFHICLSDNVSLERVQALCLGKDDVFICRGAALDDTVAANLALQCRLKTL
jgi:adenine-specific DNA-methyltransferase